MVTQTESEIIKELEIYLNAIESIYAPSRVTFRSDSEVDDYDFGDGLSYGKLTMINHIRSILNGEKI